MSIISFDTCKGFKQAPLIFETHKEWDAQEYSMANYERWRRSISSKQDVCPRLAINQPQKYPCLAFLGKTITNQVVPHTQLIFFLYDYTITEPASV